MRMDERASRIRSPASHDVYLQPRAVDSSARTRLASYPRRTGKMENDRGLLFPANSERQPAAEGRVVRASPTRENPRRHARDVYGQDTLFRVPHVYSWRKCSAR